jgi:exodeoxyribonuclease V alpha subunit
LLIGCHLLLVGDPDQLPSVGAGEVLADLLRAAVFPVTTLTHIFRQGAGSGIAQNARRINAGELPRFGGDIGDCFLVPADDPATAAQMVVDLVARRLPARYGFTPGDVQVLAPMHRGAGALDTLLQERLNSARDGLPEARAGGRASRPGDRVLQLKNDYDLGVFNGDLGTVRAVDPIEQEVLLVLDEPRRTGCLRARSATPGPAGWAVGTWGRMIRRTGTALRPAAMSCKSAPNRSTDHEAGSRTDAACAVRR